MYKRKPDGFALGFGLFGAIFMVVFVGMGAFIGYQFYIGYQMQQACLASKDLKSFECQMISHRQNVNLDITNR